MSQPPADQHQPLPWLPRLVLFDLDDTLCDYAGARNQRLRIAFGHALAAVRPRETRTTGALTAPAADPVIEALIAASIAIHPHGADHFADLLRPYGVSAAAAEVAAAWYRANRFHGLDLHGDTLATLAMVRATLPGRVVGLITNGPAELQRTKIARLGLAPLVDFAVVSGELGVEKPDPAIFREALRLGNAAAEEAVFVGDSPDHDIAGARAAGIRAVWLNRAGRPWVEVAPPGHPPPAHEARDLATLAELLGDARPGPAVPAANGEGSNDRGR
jgi:putative hydrolase of the HAD superfamily